MPDYPVSILDGDRMSTGGWVFRSEEPPKPGDIIELEPAGGEDDPLLRILVVAMYVHPNGRIEAALTD